MEPLLHSELLFKTFGEDALHTLKCSICLDFFDDPVALSCGHTFCRACIQDTANYAIRLEPHIPVWKVVLFCPECRRPCNANQVARKGAKIPSNYPIASLLSTLENRLIPLKVDATTNTATGSTSQETQTTSYTEPEVTYNTDQLEELESAILKLCRPDADADGREPNSIASCSDMLEDGTRVPETWKQQKIAKLVKNKDDAPVGATLKPWFPRKTSNITDFTTDPEVLRYYNSLI